MPRKHRHEFAAYKITCSVDGRGYVGIKTRAILDRWSSHKHLAKTGKKHPLYDAIRNHGASAFSVEHVASAYSWTALLEVEAALIRQLNSKVERHGYNITDGGTIGPAGKRIGEDEREMRSAALLRHYADPIAKAKHLAASLSPAVRAKMEETKRSRRGGKCRNGHSTADAYRFPSIPGKLRCRQCSADRDARGYGKLPKLPLARGGVMYLGTTYKNLRAVALATGHSPSWATTNYRKGVIRAA